MVEPAEILRYARDVILDSERKWVKGAFYADANGDAVSATMSDKAERFCTVGAICRAGYVLGSKSNIEALDAVSPGVPQVFDSKIHAFNDHPDTTFADVLDLLDLGVKRLEDPFA